MPIELIHVAIPGQASALHRLQRAAYAVEAGWLGSPDFPPLRETLEELCSAAETTLGAWDGGHLWSALAYQVSGLSVQIHKLIVDPGHFRMGLGSMLVRQLLLAFPGFPVGVTTGSGNAPALRLYRAFGFKPMRTWRAREGLDLVMLVRSAGCSEGTGQEPGQAPRP